MTGRTTRRTVLGSTLGTALAAPAIAQTFPDRPIRLVVPFTAGGGTDIAGREIARRMSDTLGQPVVVENRPGGNTAVAADYVARSRAARHILGGGEGAGKRLPMGPRHRSTIADGRSDCGG